jgi:glutamyl-tRNA synthetase
LLHHPRGTRCPARRTGSAKEKPRYDGRWRPEAGKTLPTPPADVPPVIRFKNPKDGVVAWDDQVKGRIEFANGELDDLIIARADGTPTYNFCVCVDDWDMGITHVIRGDDHVNNTPRQINILQALGAEVPIYAHLSMILGDDGAKLSKRHGAVSVMQYDEDGFLTEAVINYLARLGWSHGDDEVFSRQQFVEWFDLDHITASAAQFNTEKLLWLNQHYMKLLPPAELAAKVKPAWPPAASIPRRPRPGKSVALYVDRCNTLNVLADAVEVFYAHVTPNPELLAQHLATKPARRWPILRRVSLKRGLGSSGHQRPDQGNGDQAWPEDAQAGHAAARHPDRPGADAVGRCGDRPDRPRQGPLPARTKSLKNRGRPFTRTNEVPIMRPSFAAGV